VAKEVEKILAFRFEPMGAQKVKNIAEPVPVFRIRPNGTFAERQRPLPLRRVWPWAAAIAAVGLAIVGAWFACQPLTPRADLPLPGKTVSVPELGSPQHVFLASDAFLGFPPEPQELRRRGWGRGQRASINPGDKGSPHRRENGR
jgi:hypothetical protein